MIYGLLSLLACSGSPKEPAETGESRGETADTGAGDTGAEPADDVLASAYGGCVQQAILSDSELGEIGVRETDFDEDGDYSDIVADYSDDETFYDYEIVYLFGAPHELATAQTTYTRDDAVGDVSRYTWVDSDKIHEEWDYGPDGVVDESADYTYDDHLPSVGSGTPTAMGSWTTWPT